MKKILLVLTIALGATSLVHAQEEEHSKSFIKEFTLGVMVDEIATHNFGEKKFVITVTTINPSLNLITKKWCAHLIAGLSDSSVALLAGKLLPRSVDVYALYSHGINSNEMYGSIGIEKILSIHKNFDIALFFEGGTNFKSGEENKQSISMGVVFHPQLSLLRKHKNTKV